MTKQDKLERPDNRQKAARILLPLLLAAVIAFIFSNSLQVAAVSGTRSLGVLEKAKEILEAVHLQPVAESLTDHIIRKLGHFSEFMLEGVVLMLCLRAYAAKWVRYLAWPMLGGLLTAMSDETIQLFVDGRSSEVKDVWIDFSGVIAGLCVAALILWLCRCIARNIRTRRQRRAEA